MVERREGNLAELERWDEVHDRAVKAEAAVALLKAGNKIKAADFGLANKTLAAAELAREAAASDFQDLVASLTPFSTAAVRRLESALALLESDAVMTRVPDGPARRSEAHALYSCAAYLGGRVLGEIPPMIWAQNAVADLIGRIIRNRMQNDGGMINALLRAQGLLHERAVVLSAKIGDSVPYPFEHAHEGITLRRFILPTIPPKESLGELTRATGEAAEKIAALYTRVFGRLAVTALEVERACGLPPLTSADHDDDG
jgi:hypothetical protein